MDSVDIDRIWDALDGRVPNLRDYFAARAMTALIPEFLRLREISAAKTAEAAYEMANAMIKARDK